MRKSIFTLALTTALITATATCNVFGADFSAANYYELENILLEQMSKYNHEFEIKYTGSLDNIEDVLKKSLSKDTYINSNVKSIGWEITGTTKTSNIDVNVDYVITSAKRAAADNQIEIILAEIIKPGMNDHEKVKAVHDYIILNGKYDTSMQLYSDYDLLTQGTSVCNGYALLTYNMLSKLNIPVELVTGTGNNQLHIWNMVKLGDHWFHLDTTWDDPLPDSNTVSYNYYMLTEKQITKDHTIDENLELPNAVKSYYDYLKELSYDKLLMETELDIYDDVNTAENESELLKLLEYKIKHHPLKISVRINKESSQESIVKAISNLLDKYIYISEIAYGQLNIDNTGEYYVLNLYIKYKETPTSIVFDFSDKVYNTATKVDFNVYAMYGNKKVNINDSVLLYPYDKNKIDISGNSLTFKQAGSFNLQFEYQGLQETAKINALNSSAFEYITNKKPSNPVNVKVYDQYIDFSSINQWPFIENGRTMVPLRAVFEVMNCNVRWEQSKSAAVVEYEGTTILIPANSSTAYINGTASTLDVTAMLVNDRIMVPLRFISEAIDKTVIWDDINKTVLIY
ncbi:MAG: transglutaminase [Sedimentibacter sp.]|jgi:transglutaminase-like putative cysteine protease|nr:transglutaminase [Sedimentibacter sp.]